MEVRLSKPASTELPWICNVKLRFIQDGKMVPLPTPREIAFGPAIIDRDEVGEMLRRAQRAALNPTEALGIGINGYLKGVEENGTDEMKFTENTVIVDIVDVGLGHLTLIDLPGIIHATASGDDSEYIALVTNMVEKYIKNDKTIIGALSIISDLFNSF